MEQKAKETEAVFYEKSVEKDLRRTCSVFFTFNLVVSFLLLTLPLSVWAEKVIILHTNDIHCGVEDNIGLAKVAQYKKDLLKETPYVALVDAGDAVQGAPVGKLSGGMSVVKMMNAAGYDFLIPGNHEFDYGMEQFFKLAKKQKQVIIRQIS